MNKTKYSKVCERCVHDCKVGIMYSENDCENYILGYTSEEYWKMIKEENLDIKKFCNKNGLSNNCLLNMLNNKQEWKYKYRILLEQRIAEKEEYLPYLEDEDGEK